MQEKLFFALRTIVGTLAIMSITNDWNMISQIILVMCAQLTWGITAFIEGKEGI